MPLDSPKSADKFQSPGVAADDRKRIALVTGMSGAGKTTALRVLEDLGWEAIDNFPIRMLDRLIDGPDPSPGPARGEMHPMLAIGFDARTRGFVPNDIISLVRSLAGRDDLVVTTLFLDCNSAELERRYNETRRRHPLAHGRPVIEGIKAERELLEPLRRWADAVIDTSGLATNQLQQEMRERFAVAASAETSITITSFGFARGMPPLADFVFDMRFLDNPHWVSELRDQTGLDAPVAAYIASNPAFASAFGNIRDLLLGVIPEYKRQGKSYLTIAFGCTGGRHRSVYTAQEMGRALREAGFSPTVVHRNLESRAADQIEGPQT
ncbi:RNase adapter RapZ [Altererythrobacter sp. SALINAS58]|nr:RNase adapter RapZ [Alteripontixanthobacter muriae]NTZ42016.1 RNase adapter RapZ [Alteripontixanthobacter muriae]